MQRPNADTLKMIAGALIIAAAAFIMLPDLAAYAQGLWRLAIMIALVVAIAASIALASVKAISAKKRLLNASKPGTDSNARSDSLDALPPS